MSDSEHGKYNKLKFISFEIFEEKILAYWSYWTGGTSIYVISLY